ncbi:hypothetical protein [Endozoicomonas sp. OPT23]|uniref:hypothetical protein n=1 Tax=Endozoicomonas sp. OPT23 TaxID=2072845 RepID=UPI00129B3AF4|nr:hypothetical protein [Endozoicomonas sp. OPT23]
MADTPGITPSSSGSPRPPRGQETTKTVEEHASFSARTVGKTDEVTEYFKENSGVRTSGLTPPITERATTKESVKPYSFTCPEISAGNIVLGKFTPEIADNYMEKIAAIESSTTRSRDRVTATQRALSGCIQRNEDRAPNYYENRRRIFQ